MPTAPTRICAHPGCSTITSTRYCSAHQTDAGLARAAYEDRRRQDPALAEAARIRNSANWQKLRALHRAQFPLCSDPFNEHRDSPAPNQQSHHIKPLRTAPPLALEWDNLAPLCTRCHARIEAMERAGRRTAALFAECPANRF